jgi:hypothetical protein
LFVRCIAGIALALAVGVLAGCGGSSGMEDRLIALEELSSNWRLNETSVRGEDILCGQVVDQGDVAASAEVFFERTDLAVFMSQVVRRYEDGGAEQFMADLRELEAKCEMWTSDLMDAAATWSKSPSGAPALGDENVSFRLSTEVPERGIYYTDTVFIRRGDTVASMVYGGFFSGGATDPAVLEQLTQLVDRKLQQDE